MNQPNNKNNPCLDSNRGTQRTPHEAADDRVDADADADAAARWAQQCAAEGEIALRECEIPLEDAILYGICHADGSPLEDLARCEAAMFAYVVDKFTAMVAIQNARQSSLSNKSE